MTGGYPVLGYVRDADVDPCAQLVPGPRVRSHPTPARQHCQSPTRTPSGVR
ncbi:hypothetical protein [Geodermatophilus sp. URMC 62]|uniref:hypothetical protein n=1 Tax=Geodermatophilus sp. URMC 62 TaxID=3423414 RepID=UPI00406C39CA